MSGCRSVAVIVTVTVLAVLVAGCAGLPPKPQAAKLPPEAPLRGLTTEGGAWPAPDWWKQYKDPDLDRLMDMALESSPTLATAHARFDSARQSVRIAGAAAGAHVEASGDASRQRLSDNGLFPPQLLGFHWYNQYDLGVQASYTFDWWGKQRDSVEAAIDEAHAAQADRSAAALMLASSVQRWFAKPPSWRPAFARNSNLRMRCIAPTPASRPCANRSRPWRDRHGFAWSRLRRWRVVRRLNCPP